MKLFFFNGLIYLALSLGLFFTVWGLSYEHLGVLPWTKEGFIRFVLFITFCSSSILLSSYLFKKNTILISFAILAFLILWANAVLPILIIILIIFSSIILGRKSLSFLNISIEKSSFPIEFLIGIGIFGSITGLMAHFPINYPILYWFLLLLPLFINWTYSKKYASEYLLKIKSFCLQEDKNNFLEVAISTISIFLVVVSLLPETGHDALTMHLFVPSQMALRHQWSFNPDFYAMGLIPQLGAWIYSIGYILEGETTSRLTNTFFIFIIARLIYEFVQFIGGSKNSGKWATLLFLTTPLTYTESSSLFIESIWAAYITAAIFLFFNCIFKAKFFASSLKTTAISLGFAAATKAATLPSLPIFLLIILLNSRKYLAGKGKVSLLICALLFFIVSSVPYLTSFFITKNPVFPFFNGTFKSPNFPLVNFDNSLFKSGISWDLPYNLVFNSGKYLEASNGAGGFQWLLLFLPAVIIILFKKNKKATALLLVSSLIFISTFYFQSYLRYVYPSYILFIVCIGVAIFHLCEKKNYLTRFYIFATVLCIFLNTFFITSGSWNHRDFQISILNSEKSKKDYVRARQPVRSAVEFINTINYFSEPVAFLSQGFAAGINADALFANWHNYRFNDALSSSKNAEDLIKVFRNYNATIIILENTWNSDQKRNLVKSITDEVFSFDSVKVLKIKPEFLFFEQISKNSTFENASEWNLQTPSIFVSELKALKVSVSLNATQKIVIEGSRHYRNTIKSKCFKKNTQGRLQVNWHDKRNRFITSTIKVFNCNAKWEYHTMDIVAPANATSAILYTTGHLDEPILFRLNALYK